MSHTERFVMLLVGACMVGLLVLPALSHFFSKPTQSGTVDLPADPDVESITATVYAVDGFSSAVPTFAIPGEYFVRLLSAIKPAETANYPASWDEDTMAILKIKTKTGQTNTITFCFPGKNRLCFQVDGVRCVRGGRYDPVFVGERHESWLPECCVLAGILAEIQHETLTGEKSAIVADRFEDLERSAGKRPPRRPSP
jgi:hypothetical protein